jgi:hypothetical protein
LCRSAVIGAKATIIIRAERLGAHHGREARSRVRRNGERMEQAAENQGEKENADPT